MPDTTRITPARVTQTVRELRKALGLTQAQFARVLDVSIATAVRYESTRPPTGGALRKLHAVALSHGFEDHAFIFKAANTADQLGGIPPTIHEALWTQTLYAILRNRRITEPYDLLLLMERKYSELAAKAEKGEKVFGLDQREIRHLLTEVKVMTDQIRSGDADDRY